MIKLVESEDSLTNIIRTIEYSCEQIGILEPVRK